VLGSAGTRFSYYIVGFFMLVGGLLGRFVCGFLCPFGWIQELLHKIPFPVKKRTFRLDRPLRHAKYAILAIFVIILPLTVVNAAGGGSPWFCKWICPAGTLEAGLPLVALTPALRGIVGWLFGWKAFVLLAVIAGSVIIARPFCKYICPLGAVYGLFNRAAILRYRFNADQCVRCGKCAAVCPMAIDPVAERNHAECVRCGNCRHACPRGAIGLSVGRGSQRLPTEDRAVQREQPQPQREA
jgi:polyferredoxin